MTLKINRVRVVVKIHMFVQIFIKLRAAVHEFKVIDVGTTGKLVSSACDDKQRVFVYLQPFSR